MPKHALEQNTLKAMTGLMTVVTENSQENSMVIEWLKVRVDPDKREQYVQKDEEIWTKALSKYPGFLGKEVWISPDDLSQVVLIIRWESFEKWQAVPEADMEQVEARFAQAMGSTNHEIVESAGYQIRKLMQPA
jgi:uncharacterized protein (TIGR03792 family)